MTALEPELEVARCWGGPLDGQLVPLATWPLIAEESTGPSPFQRRAVIYTAAKIAHPRGGVYRAFLAPEFPPAQLLELVKAALATFAVLGWIS